MEKCDLGQLTDSQQEIVRKVIDGMIDIKGGELSRSNQLSNQGSTVSELDARAALAELLSKSDQFDRSATIASWVIWGVTGEDFSAECVKNQVRSRMGRAI
jgi:hypothetical protein